MNSELNPPLINNNSVRSYWLTVYKKTRVAVVIKFLVFFWCSRWTRDFIGYEILSLPLIAQSGRIRIRSLVTSGIYFTTRKVWMNSRGTMCRNIHRKYSDLWTQKMPNFILGQEKFKSMYFNRCFAKSCICFMSKWKNKST